MTAGRVVILGDPGPYAFSGMTGGVVYQMLTPEMGFDEAALRQRIALGAQVQIQEIGPDDVKDLQRLLQYYIEALEQTYQYETAEHIRSLSDEKAILERFVKVVPKPTAAVPTPVELMAEDMAE